MTTPTRVQVYGERCSGTNWIAQLLLHNVLSIRVVDDFGWKHGWVQGDVDHAGDCAFVVVHRDPFDWLRSLHRTPWHAAPELRSVPFARFVRTPWRCLWGADMALADRDPRAGTEMRHERDPATGAPFRNVMHLRSAKMRSWDELPARVLHHVDVRYEEVLRDPRAFVQGFAARFGLRRWPWFRSVTTFKGGRGPYVPKQYAPIAADDLAWIGSQLDVEQEAAHGFDVRARTAALAVHAGEATAHGT